MKPKNRGYCDDCGVSLPAGSSHNKRFCSGCRPPYIRKRVKPVDANGNHVCEMCRSPFLLGAHSLTRFCWDCGRKRASLSHAASVRRSATASVYAVLRVAIRHGFLPHPKTLICVDCGKPADCYDHRDYNKPLDVAAVCTGCNVRRGPAKPRLSQVIKTAA